MDTYLKEGEWPEGVSPSGSRRTEREPLDSLSSHCPAIGPREPPMSKQRRIAARDAHQPALCPFGMASQPLVFQFVPAHKLCVDASEEWIQPGPVEAPVVVDPSLHNFVEEV